MEERTNLCARAEDLVAYLYKEATPAEARDFESHMENCAACQVEIAAFGDVREAIGEWRELSLGALSSPAFKADAAFSRVKAGMQRRSAIAALREFFTLSPAWMRAATAFAAVIFCALAAIAVIHFTSQPQVVVLEKPAQTETAANSEAPTVATNGGQNDAGVKVQPEPPKQEAATGVTSQSPKQNKRRSDSAPRLIVKHKKVSPRAVNKSPEEEVAAADDYLPFTASGREEKLPSLADLVDELN